MDVMGLDESVQNKDNRYARTPKLTLFFFRTVKLDKIGLDKSAIRPSAQKKTCRL